MGLIALVLVLAYVQVRLVRTHPRYVPSAGTYGAMGGLTFVSALLVWWSVSIPAMVVALLLAIAAPVGTSLAREYYWRHLTDQRRRVG